MIREITLKNFKSFTDIKFNFLGKNKKPQNLAFIYGANGSGKTNFVDSFYFLDSTFQTFDMHSFIAEFMSEKKEDLDPVKIKAMIDLYSMSNLIKRYKTTGSTSNMVIEFNFLCNEKIGVYHIEFDDEQIVRERLEYTLAKNKGIFFDISTTSSKFNSMVFSGDYISDLKDLQNKYWGKHSLMSILYHLRQDYSEEYANSQINEAILDILDYFNKTTCHLVDAKSRRENIGYFSGLLKRFDEGKIQANEYENLKQTEQLINCYFTNLYQDIQKVFYDIRTNDDGQIRYTLYFQKKISGKLVDVSYKSESFGTRSLLQLLPFFVATNHNAVVAIDEIDNGIHDLLLTQLIEKVIPCINGQLLITTHNTLFLENYDLRNNIYIIGTDDDGNKVVKALSDNAFRVQKTSNILANYYNGKFGGIPVIESNFDFNQICQYSHQEC